jgi:hypothetical protein
MNALFFLLIYFNVAMFVLGVGLADEMSFVNPNYKLVFGVAVAWPIVGLYAVGQRVFA